MYSPNNYLFKCFLITSGLILILLIHKRTGISPPPPFYLWDIIIISWFYQINTKLFLSDLNCTISEQLKNKQFFTVPSHDWSLIHFKSDEENKDVIWKESMLFYLNCISYSFCLHDLFSSLVWKYCFACNFSLSVVPHCCNNHKIPFKKRWPGSYYLLLILLSMSFYCWMYVN